MNKGPTGNVHQLPYGGYGNLIPFYISYVNWHSKHHVGVNTSMEGQRCYAWIPCAAWLPRLLCKTSWTARGMCYSSMSKQCIY